MGNAAVPNYLADLSVSEIYGPTIWGEGALAGRPTVVVHFGGCDYRCAWCDSLHSVLPENRGSWRSTQAKHVLSEIGILTGERPYLVTLSGGNPALFDLSGLLAAGAARGHTFAMETQGSKAWPWFKYLDYLTLSPKPPSSEESYFPKKLRDCIKAATADPSTAPDITMKIPIRFGDSDDIDFARMIRQGFSHYPLYLQPVQMPDDQLVERPPISTMIDSMNWIFAQVADDPVLQDVRILPQLQVLLHGNRMAPSDDNKQEVL